MCKGCKCKPETKCLKRYCICLKENATCGPDCGCQKDNCENTTSSDHQKGRKDAFIRILTSGENSFKPKVNPNGAHYKGCKCNKSKCGSKYCECFENGVKCTDLCKCNGCTNGKCNSNHS